MLFRSISPSARQSLLLQQTWIYCPSLSHRCYSFWSPCHTNSLSLKYTSDKTLHINLPCSATGICKLHSYICPIIGRHLMLLQRNTGYWLFEDNSGNHLYPLAILTNIPSPCFYYTWQAKTMLVDSKDALKGLSVCHLSIVYHIAARTFRSHHHSATSPTMTLSRAASFSCSHLACHPNVPHTQRWYLQTNQASWASQKSSTASLAHKGTEVLSFHL